MLSQTAREAWMRRAIQLAIDNVETAHGGPFGALVVRGDELIATGVNLVVASNDPTAHAEVSAIRAACRALDSFQLSGCEIYSSCEPCPMCLGAIFWARPAAFFFASSRAQAAAAGFDDAFIYEQLTVPPAQRSIPGYQLLSDEGATVFEKWRQSTRKIAY